MLTSHEDIGSDTTNKIKAIRTTLLQAHEIAITTHINPDGDALGSSLALQHWLSGNGAKADVILPNAAPSNLQWMPGIEKAIVWGADNAHSLSGYDVIVVLDLNAISRLGSLGAAVLDSGATIINIDHHTHPESFAAIAWVDVEACSTCYMIGQLIVDGAVEAEISAECATCLYSGLMTDTGSFRFPRTTGDVFRLAGLLVEKGANPVSVYDNIMNQGSIGRTRLLGATLSSMGIHAHGRLCTLVVTADDLSSYGCTLEDTEGFVQQALALEGVTMGILFVELPDEIKCSFRSKGTSYVRDLAATYGGGGHVYAAGARIRNRDLVSVVADVTMNATTCLQATMPESSGE